MFYTLKSVLHAERHGILQSLWRVTGLSIFVSVAPGNWKYSMNSFRNTCPQRVSGQPHHPPEPAMPPASPSELLKRAQFPRLTSRWPDWINLCVAAHTGSGRLGDHPGHLEMLVHTGITLHPHPPPRERTGIKMDYTGLWANISSEGWMEINRINWCCPFQEGRQREMRKPLHHNWLFDSRPGTARYSPRVLSLPWLPLAQFSFVQSNKEKQLFPTCMLFV